MRTISKIAQNINEYPPSFRRVAQAIIDNPEQVKFMSIASLSGLAKVSDPTILRFCRSLGFNGFKDFKFHLTEEEAKMKPYVDQEEIDGSDGYIRQMCALSISTFAEVERILGEQDIDKAVDILANAVKIEFWGRCASAAVAQDAYDKFFTAGIPCYVTTDLQMLRMSAGLSKPGDVIVAISHTGVNPDLIDGIKIAKSKGAFILGITIENSPVANECSMAIHLNIKEDKGILSAMVVRFAHLFVLDTLAVGVLLQKGAMNKNGLVLNKDGLVLNKDSLAKEQI
ncbi:MAG: SIS domain-containing protein [Eubacteriales bacterium]|nr:SIS domain-containing protein [Eubacteriales bacterium]